MKNSISISQAHTPGPWCVEEEKSLRHVILGIGEFYICTNETPQNIEADARLIAAAPELLEACKLMTQAIEQGAESMSASPIVCEHYAQMMSAIAKAEGKA